MTTDAIRMDGKVAVITGGAGGIGFATAQLMSARGAHVVLADIAVERAKELAATLPDAIGLMLDLGDEGSVEAMIAAARAMNRPVLVDPKGSDWRPYRGATLITPNLSELEAVVGPCPDEATIVAKGTRLRDELGIDALLVTRSENGMTLLAPNQPPLHLPTRAREVFDVTGAGDTVISTLAASIAAGEATVLFLADIPDQVQLLTIDGRFKMGFRNPNTGEEATFTQAQLDAMLVLGRKGVAELCVLQQQVIESAMKPAQPNDLKKLADFFGKK